MHLLKLVNNQTSPQIISQAIRTAQERNQEFKRKHNDLDDIDPLSAEVSEIEDTDDHVVAPTTSSIYTTAMEFVKNFKQTRIKNGQKRMDWVGCLSEDQRWGTPTDNLPRNGKGRPACICTSKIVIRSTNNAPDIVSIKRYWKHEGHQPNSIEDLRSAPVSREIKDLIQKMVEKDLTWTNIEYDLSR